MARSRSLSCPRATSSHQRSYEDTMAGAQSPYPSAMTHSRDSSAASTASSPITPTFSARSHGHWSSSNSSLIASTPESPINLSKFPLGDLVEQPEEREEDDSSFDLSASADHNADLHNLCICDAPFCDHQKTPKTLSTAIPSNDVPEWLPGDDSALFSHPLHGFRASSGDLSPDSLSSRFGRRLSILSKRWRDHQPTTSLSITSVRSAPPSRTSSLRLPSIKRSLATALDVAGTTQPAFDLRESQAEEANDLPVRKSPPAPLYIPSSAPLDDSVDGAELSTTPLLPPMPRAPSEHRHSNPPEATDASFQSPLQSPKVAEPNSDAISVLQSSSSTPALGSPPLSSKPSTASFHHSDSMPNIPAASDFSPVTFAPQPDYWVDSWTSRLGHANFRIFPNPYMPESCDQESCKRLLDDWELARTKYMRHAQQVREDYGPASNAYKLTEQKWEEIDAIWREYHESANLQAGESSNSPPLRPLAETTPIRRMPSLNDPAQPDKFPVVDTRDMVGPMVQYAKISQQPPVKKPTFLRIFTDPGSLLAKSTPTLKR